MAKKPMTRDERERARNFSKGGDTKPKSSFSKKKPAEAPASKPATQVAKPKPKAKAKTNKVTMKSSPRPQPNPNRGPSVNSEAPKLPGNAKSEAESRAKRNKLRRNG